LSVPLHQTHFANPHIHQHEMRANHNSGQ
jgi:hypothetical protein